MQPGPVAKDALPTAVAGLGRVRVWDLPTRAFHWVLALTAVASVVSAKIGGSAMDWHLRLGTLVLALLGFRLLWGVVGGRWSRFASFLYAPGTVWRYVRARSRADEHHDVGHSPLGSLSVWALLFFLSLQVATGLVADDEIVTVGPLNRFVGGAVASAATFWHKNFGEWILIALVALHVLAVLYYTLVRRNNLVGPMIHGDKLLGAGTPHSLDNTATRALALLLAALCGLGAWWIYSLGG